MGSLGPFYSERGVGGGGEHHGRVMMKELMKGKELVGVESGAYETNPESGMFSHLGGPGTQKERGMLARWDLWADTGLQN